MCRKAYGNLAGWQSPRAWDTGPETFAGMVEVSRALMRGKTAAQQRDAVIKGFPRIPSWFRVLFPFTLWGAELNARITPAFFSWLVGPMETRSAEIPKPGDPHGTLVTAQSAVYIKKCRYLEESACVGMCVNLCKAPTEYFFTNELGVPLYMKPNFETKECVMTFGLTPPPLDQDPEIYNTPCYAACPTRTAVASSAKPKLGNGGPESESDGGPRCPKIDLGPGAGIKI